MTDFRIDDRAIHDFDVVIGRAPRNAVALMTREVRHHTALLQQRVKKRAKALFGRSGVTAGGRPVSRPHTGDYIRSITREVHGRVGGAEGIVGTNAVQGRRLEHGFVGTDSAGRHYNQPPYAHFRPAADETLDEFADAVARAFYGVLDA